MESSAAEELCAESLRRYDTEAPPLGGFLWVVSQNFSRAIVLHAKNTVVQYGDFFFFFFLIVGVNLFAEVAFFTLFVKLCVCQVFIYLFFFFSWKNSRDAMVGKRTEKKARYRR